MHHKFSDNTFHGSKKNSDCFWYTKVQENSKENTYMKVKSSVQAYILENVTCNIFDKNT